MSTKIVATLGPTSDDVKTITSLHREGMSIARLNFSHGNHSYFEKLIKRIRRVSKEIAIMLDTKGPEIRSGEVEGGEIELCHKDTPFLTNKEVVGTTKQLTIRYSNLFKLKKGDIVLIEDGLIELEVISSTKKGVKTKVLNGGKLGSNKTVSLRGHYAKLEFLSKKDKEDIEFGIQHRVDFIAASFVRTADDVKSLKRILAKHNSNIKVISKIEHGSAVENCKEITKESFGIMVARGDLGVEIPLERVPLVQQDIINYCNKLGRPVIVATQMLESMRDNPVPTRAEVSDVAQAILDGTDAIMLSGETASGKYPLKAVKMMRRIAKEYDSKVVNPILGNQYSTKELKSKSISMFVTKAAYLASESLDLGALITPTESGYTARKVSRFKPKCQILAITRDMEIFRQLQLSWGVKPFFVKKKFSSISMMIYEIISFFYRKELLKLSDTVAITAGHTLAKGGNTNILELYTVDHVIKKHKRSKH